MEMEYEKKPLIGITCHTDFGGAEDLFPGTALNYIDRAYANAAAACGMTPIMIPVVLEKDYILDILARIDGLVCSGGGKKRESHLQRCEFPPLSESAPERYDFERELYLRALDMDMPMLGMCRGMQMVNEILGGTMYYNVKEQIEGAAEHNQSKIGIPDEFPYHDISISKDSHLYRILSAIGAKVNSLHLQSVKEPGRGLQITAVSADNVVEALESREHPFVVLTQFHPELLTRSDKIWNKLFLEFKNQAIAYQKRR